MNDKERLQLEEELLMTCSKAQAINKYIDELEESSKLSELWCKSQQENTRLKYKLNKINDLLNEPIFEYDNIPCNIENEIIQLKDILKEN